MNNGKVFHVIRQSYTRPGIRVTRQMTRQMTLTRHMTRQMTVTLSRFASAQLVCPRRYADISARRDITGPTVVNSLSWLPRTSSLMNPGSHSLR